MVHLDPGFYSTSPVPAAGLVTELIRSRRELLTIDSDVSGSLLVGKQACAGLNRHVVGDERAPTGKENSHPGLESCRGHREVAPEA
jgi:hypothetical protein